MTDYAKWAKEYKNSAEITMTKIRALEAKRKKGLATPKDERKLLILYEMYGDCMCSYRELMRKAQSVRGVTNYGEH